MSGEQREMFEITEGKREASLSREEASGVSPESYGVPFQRHSETSKEAAAALEGSETLRALVYKAITSSGARGMTDPEAQAELGWSGSPQRPRRGRRGERGLGRDSGNRRASEAGRLCTVWVAS